MNEKKLTSRDYLAKDMMIIYKIILIFTKIYRYHML